MPAINDKILIKVASEYTWAKVERVIIDVYTIPLYCCVVLEGKHAGAVVATTSYLDHAVAGAFISHEFPEVVNAQGTGQ